MQIKHLVDLINKGTVAILETLLWLNSPKNSITEKKFLKTFNEKYYYTLYSRNRAILLEYGLIEYDVAGFEKTIMLTSKGVTVFKIMRALEFALTQQTHFEFSNGDFKLVGGPEDVVFKTVDDYNKREES